MKLNELDKKSIDKALKDATLLDDLMFIKLCEDKKAIEEILRVILNNKTINVVEVKEQKPVVDMIYHSGVFDCLCTDDKNNQFNIEVQYKNNDDMQKRIRYNASIFTVETTKKDKDLKYREIKDLTLIMICNFDIFKYNKSIYYIDRVIRDEKKVVNNGIQEIYVNLKATNFERNDLEKLSKIFKENSYYDYESFSKLSNKKQEIINYERGKGMSYIIEEIEAERKDDWLKEGIQKGKQEGIIQILVEMVKNNKLTKKEAAERIQVTEKEFDKYLNKI